MLEGSEITLQVMAKEFEPKSKSLAKIEFFTIAGPAWGKTKRAFGTLRVGPNLAFEYGPNVYQSLAKMETKVVRGSGALPAGDGRGVRGRGDEALTAQPSLREIYPSRR